MENKTNKKAGYANSKAAYPEKAKGKKASIVAVPFHPYHVAAIGWIFLPGGLPGGAIPQSTADIPGLDTAIARNNPSSAAQDLVKANLNSVFTELNNFLSVGGNATALQNGRAAFQQLLSTMNNLWDGDASIFTPDLLAGIASLG